MVIGILALQGDFAEHRSCLEKTALGCRLVRTPADLDGIAGLVIPGGESTAIKRLVASSGLVDPVMDLIERCIPVWGTCAGVVLLAKGGPWDVAGVRVERNAYGPQVYSRVVMARTSIAEGDVPLVFIRAPRIVDAPRDASVLCRLGDEIVALRWKNLLLTTFHPELAGGEPFTSYFASMVSSSPCRGRSMDAA